MQIDMHRVRVDDAARELDTMGPPIARLTASGGGWIGHPGARPGLRAVHFRRPGTDAPPGSWKRVWYRATAWTGDDATRGGLAGRSDASNAAFVVLPPPDPPVHPRTADRRRPRSRRCLPAMDLRLAGGQDPARPAPDSGPRQGVRRSGRDAAAAGPGHHPGRTRRSAAGGRVRRVDLRHVRRRHHLPGRRPPGGRHRAVDFAVRITDPLGRTGAQLLTIPAGPPIPRPTWRTWPCGSSPSCRAGPS